MIRLEKGTEPPILTRNAARWTSVLLGKIDAGERPTKTERSRYNHIEIKQALLAETNSKCAYCESKFGHVTFGDVEHVVPKSEDPSRWFSWSNLTVACDVCNTNKSNAAVARDSFVDPYDVDPEEYFWQFGPLVRAKPGCDAAALTERLLNLNRIDLVERRQEKMNKLLLILESVERCKDPHLKHLLWEDFTEESQSHREYAALSRSIVEFAGKKLGFGIKRADG